MFYSLWACGADVVVSPPDASERYASPLPPPLESYVAMEHPEAARSIVSGISDDAVDGHRWAEQRAVLRFHSIPLGELRFHAAFMLPDRLMQLGRRRHNQSSVRRENGSPSRVHRTRFVRNRKKARSG